MNETSQTGFAFDNAIGNAHLAAQGWQVKNELDRFNIVGNDHLEMNKSITKISSGRDSHQLSFLLLHQRRDGVHSTSNHVRSFGRSIGFAALGLFFGTLLQTEFLLRTRFGTIFLQEFKQLGRRLLVECLSELIDWWWNFQTLEQNAALTLETNVLRPFDETCQITFVLNI